MNQGSEKGADSTVEEKLRAEFKKLSGCLTKVLDANDKYRSGLLAEAAKEEEKDEESWLEERLEGNILKTADEAEAKFKEVSQIIQMNLWSRYGREEITGATLMAESSVHATADLPVESTHLEGYEVNLSLLGRRVK